MIAVGSSLGENRFFSGYKDSYIAPRILRARRPYVYLHGAGGTAEELYGGGGLTALPPILRAIIDERKVSFTCPTITETWGNQTTIDRINAAIAYQRSHLGATSDPPVLIAASHGATCAMTYAKTNPTAACVLIVPCIDLQNMRVNNILGLRGSIDAAFGVTYPAPLPAGKDPFLTPRPNVPIQIWYASDDVISTNVTPYATSAPGVPTELYSVGALGHTNAAMAAVNTATVLTFLKGYVRY